MIPSRFMRMKEKKREEKKPVTILVSSDRDRSCRGIWVSGATRLSGSFSTGRSGFPYLGAVGELLALEAGMRGRVAKPIDAAEDRS